MTSKSWTKKKNDLENKIRFCLFWIYFGLIWIFWKKTACNVYMHVISSPFQLNFILLHEECIFRRSFMHWIQSHMLIQSLFKKQLVDLHALKIDNLTFYMSLEPLFVNQYIVKALLIETLMMNIIDCLPWEK